MHLAQPRVVPRRAVVQPERHRHVARNVDLAGDEMQEHRLSTDDAATHDTMQGIMPRRELIHVLRVA